MGILYLHICSYCSKVPAIASIIAVHVAMHVATYVYRYGVQ